MPTLDELRERFARGGLVLDGALGTELERRGVATPKPLWSAAALLECPETVAAIHREYVAAGADILTANTFRTNARTLGRAGRSADGPALNQLAVRLARQAASRAGEHAARPEYPPRPEDQRRAPAEARSAQAGRWASAAGAAVVLVGASVAPVEDCYCPHLVPAESELREEHALMMRWLSAAAPDLIWIETMNTAREAAVAAQAAADLRLPFVVSFALRAGGELLSGEPLAAGVAAVEPFEPLAVGVNCLPPRGATQALPLLRSLTRRPLCVYAHINNVRPTPGWNYAQQMPPARYAACARAWRRLGAQIVGGCCGTTPAHIRAVAAERRRA